MPKGASQQAGPVRCCSPCCRPHGLESTHRWEGLHKHLSSDLTVFKSDAQISRPFPGKARLLSERSPGP